MENPEPSTVLQEYSNNDCKKIIINDYLKSRTLGNKEVIGFSDRLTHKLYASYRNYEIHPLKYCKDRGGIFNLEFSPNGRLLIAACEGKEVLMFDAVNQKQINKIDNAHLSCVNCIRFLDDKTFATCSDDATIKIWDTRKTKHASKTLSGHSNWVKNIEYLEEERLLVTSAFDGSIYTWSLDCPTETSVIHDKVFLMNGLMRTKLSPDGSKMIISTTSGYMIIIHDLNLTSLATDLRSFRPNLYRLMQTSEQNFPVGTLYNYLFVPTRKQNRIEFVDDFPNPAEVISSLQIHPHGWCALTRNLSDSEAEEWTSVHDIQKKDPVEYENAFCYIEEEELANSLSPEEQNNPRPTDLWMGYRENRHRQALQNLWDNLPSMGIINSGLIGRNFYKTYFQHNPDHGNKVIKNLPRLTHFIKEKNEGKGYIKELCFSADGRVICSPYSNGVRLLGFNENLQELSHCVPEESKELKPLMEFNNYHKGVVVCCKFNPVHSQLVSGCLKSEIKWYQPVF